MVKISIITPCFNHGIYLDDAFESIELYKYSDVFEHIIINDGSTDSFTLKKIEELKDRGSIVIHQKNKGLAEARNAGIKVAKGNYILPLDSDNKIVPEIFIEAMEILENEPSFDVVYTDAMWFGDKQNLRIVGPYDGLKLLDDNYIDACSLIRKSAILETGMYDINMPAMGHEDWELGVNFFLNNKQIYYLGKVGFYYRLRQSSMLTTVSGPNFEKNKQHIYNKHYEAISKKISVLKNENEILKKEIRSIDSHLSNQRLKSILKIFLGRKIR